MKSDLMKRAFNVAVSPFENQDEDKQTMAFCLESWLPIVHTADGEAVVWANRINIVLDVQERIILYVAMQPLLCSRKYSLFGVPKEGLTFAYRRWPEDDKWPQPAAGEPPNYLPLFATSLHLLGFSDITDEPVGCPFALSEERVHWDATLNARLAKGKRNTSSK